jgi:hypothetical protein
MKLGSGDGEKSTNKKPCQSGRLIPIVFNEGAGTAAFSQLMKLSFFESSHELQNEVWLSRF